MNPIVPQILILDDLRLVLYAWQKKLQQDVKITTLASYEALQIQLASDPEFLQAFVLVITDYRFDDSQYNGVDIAKTVKTHRPELPVLLSSSEDHTVTEGNGAIDFVIDKTPVSWQTLHTYALT